MEEKEAKERGLEFAEPGDLTEAWADAFDDLSESIANQEQVASRLADKRRNERNAALIRKHTHRKWDAIGRVLVSVIVSAAVYGFAVIGLCPAPVAAAAMFLVSGYMFNMALVVAREVAWYQCHVVRKQVRG